MKRIRRVYASQRARQSCHKAVAGPAVVTLMTTIVHTIAPRSPKKAIMVMRIIRQQLLRGEKSKLVSTLR